VVDVTTKVKGKIFLKLWQSTEVVAGPGLGHCLECRISASDIRLVVFGVMQLHDASRYVWLER
jgi:hypothetical protein